MTRRMPFAPPRRWSPLGARTQYEPPEAGRLMAWDHAVWLVLSHDPINPANWTDEDRETWQLAGMPDPWKHAPRRIHVQHVAGKLPEGMQEGCTGGIRAGGGQRLQSWLVYPEGNRWPRCSCCGWPMPCPAEVQDRYAAHALAVMEHHAQKLPGYCWACEEPVTSRQAAVEYPGINLDAPGGPAVVFHTRRKCYHSATLYEQRWLAADPRRERILTWPECPGTLLVHQDGSSECVAGGLDECRGGSTHDHRHLCACIFQSHGCGRGCTQDGHPGTRFSDRQLRPLRRATLPEA